MKEVIQSEIMLKIIIALVLIPSVVKITSSRKCVKQNDCSKEQVCVGAFKECHDRVSYGQTCKHAGQCFEENTACVLRKSEMEDDEDESTCACINEKWHHINSGGCYKDFSFCRADTDCPTNNVCKDYKCDSKKKKLGGEQITLIVFAVMFAVGGTIAFVFFLKRRRMQSRYTNTVT